MKQKSMPTFLNLSEVLEKTEKKLHPSEVHGILTGMLCSPLPQNVNWQSLVIDEDSPQKTQTILQDLIDMTEQRLKAFLFDFELIMPEDAETLMKRAEGLTLWCQGFLTGLELVHIPITLREENDVTEAINDIIEIAKMKYEDVVANEEDEAAYIELVEYVRMSVIFVYQSYQEEDSGKKESNSHYH